MDNAVARAFEWPLISGHEERVRGTRWALGEREPRGWGGV